MLLERNNSSVGIIDSLHEMEWYINIKWIEIPRFVLKGEDIDFNDEWEGGWRRGIILFWTGTDYRYIAKWRQMESGCLEDTEGERITEWIGC